MMRTILEKTIITWVFKDPKVLYLKFSLEVRKVKFEDVDVIVLKRLELTKTVSLALPSDSAMSLVLELLEFAHRSLSSKASRPPTKTNFQT